MVTFRLKRAHRGVRAVDRAKTFAAACLLCASAAGSAVAQDEGDDLDLFTSFSDLPTPVLLELSADVGAILRKRGVLPDFKDPTAAYAAYLAMGALELTANGDALVDARGERHLVLAARRGEDSAPLSAGPIDDASLSGHQRALVVAFTREFQIERGAVAPIDTVRQALQSSGDGSLELSDAFWSAEGVEDVTALLFVAAEQR